MAARRRDAESLSHVAAQPSGETPSANEPRPVHRVMRVAAGEWWKFAEMPAQFPPHRRLHRGVEGFHAVERHFVADHVISPLHAWCHDVLREIAHHRADAGELSE